MDKLIQGPQAATRNVADRRATYSNKAARSLAALEQRLERRLSALEGRPASPAAIAKCAASADLDANLDAFGELHNQLEERVLGEEIPSIEKRLQGLEERLKPFEEYQKEAANAVQQLQDARERMRTVGNATSKPDITSAKLINEHEASIREHTGRLQDLEDTVELTRAQTMSTTDLGTALLKRLGRGDVLSSALQDRLLSALSCSAEYVAKPTISSRVPLQRMPETPATEDTSVDSTADAHASEDEPTKKPKKRRRTTQNPLSTKKSASARKESEPVSTVQCENALNNFRSGSLNNTDRDAEAAAVLSLEEFIIPPEVRRTSRKPKPTKFGDEMIHWKVANEQMRGMRTSG